MRWAALICVLAGACSSSETRAPAASKEELGALLFDDPHLSEPAGQACSDCHVASAAFADPEDDRTSAGVIRDRFGVRNTPSAMYLKFAPPLHAEGDQMVGGLFWDGRASDFAAQAAGPLLNPLEMNNPDKAAVVRKVKQAYGRDMTRLFGPDVFDDTDRAFAALTAAIGAFERTEAFSPFSSRYDRYLAGTATLDEHEQRGLAVFEDPARGNCASCHPSRPSADGTGPVFTTYGYANLAVPVFRDNPFYSMPAALNPDGASYVDHGLAATTKNPAHEGMFRIPSLRNVVRTTPYGHDGYFRRLDEMIGHHASVDPAIKLTPEDIADLVAFLGTLTDANVER
jgi:cytochrome c peroxidase